MRINQNLPVTVILGTQEAVGRMDVTITRILIFLPRCHMTTTAGQNEWLALGTWHLVGQVPYLVTVSLRPSLGWNNTHTHTHLFNGPLSGTTRVSQYQNCKTILDFTGARDSEWQWHQLGHMQVCTSVQTDNHASTPPLGWNNKSAKPLIIPLPRTQQWRRFLLKNQHKTIPIRRLKL